MHRDSKIYIAGHTGMVGSALVRHIRAQGYNKLLLRTRAQLNLLNEAAVAAFFQEEKPDVVILAAARVGGIQANIDHPAEFIYENLAIQNHVIHHAHLNQVKKFCMLGSSCMYPRECPQPIKEEYILTGPLEPTNEGYAVAKIAGMKMVEYYRKQYGFPGISVIPCNLYGENDSFDPRHSHVLSALVKKFTDACDDNLSEVSVWGTGKARREFMYVDDAAAAIWFALEHYDQAQCLNIGTGEEISIYDLVHLVAELTGYKGTIQWDSSKPDGMPRKCMDVSRMKALGFTPQISLREGILRTIEAYRKFQGTARG